MLERASCAHAATTFAAAALRYTHVREPAQSGIDQLQPAAVTTGHLSTAGTVEPASERHRAAAILRGALLGACRAGRSTLVAALLAAGADPNALGPCRRCIGGGVVVEAEASALAETCASGHVSIAEMLLDAGASVDGIPHPDSAKAPNQPVSVTSSCTAAVGVYGNGANAGAAAGAAIITTSPAAASPFTLPPALAVALEDAAKTSSAAAAPMDVDDAAGCSDGSGAKRRRSSNVGGLLICAHGGGDSGIVPKYGSDPAAAASTAASRLHRSAFAWSNSDDDETANRGGSYGVPLPSRPTTTLDAGGWSLQLVQQLRTPPRELQPALTPPTGPSSWSLDSDPATPLRPGISAPPPLAPRQPRCRPRLPLKPLPPFPLTSFALPPLSSSSALLPLGPPPSLLSPPAPPRAASPLLAACRAGQPDAAALLLRRGAGVDVVRGSELLAATDPRVVDILVAAAPTLAAHLGAALVAAAGRGQADVVAALLRHGADPAHERGMAVCEAAYQGYTDVLELLLRAGGPRLASTCGPALASAHSLALRFDRLAAAEILQPVGQQALGGSATLHAPLVLGVPSA